MLRTWAVVPTSAQIVRDILRFPAALDAIIAAEGAKVDWADVRQGRRRPKSQVCVLVPCPEAEELQRVKYQRFDPM
eukprot:3064819-Prymnesium_polylepis.1